MTETTKELKLAGFWIRVLATLIDWLILYVPIYLVLAGLYPGYFEFDGRSQYFGFSSFIDFLFTWGIPLAYVMYFWSSRGATPGKLIVGIKIVDSKTLAAPSVRSLWFRYFAYFVSVIPLMLGLLWVGWDKKKQGFHDKLAGTLVVYKQPTTMTNSESGTPNLTNKDNSMEAFLNLKNPVVILVGAVAVLLILYYLMSPYRNCMRGQTARDSASLQAYCLHKTSW